MRKVLLVDDEKFIRLGIRTIIERSGTGFQEIHECANGREALDRISRENFDLVVVDMRMPNMDGITFMKEAQSLEVKPKFVILSGYSDFHYAAEGIKYGAKAYLLKPVQRDELIDVLKRIEGELLKEENISKVNQKANEIYDKFRSSELKNILLADNLPERKVAEILENLDIHIFDMDYAITIIHSRDPMRYAENESSMFAALVEEYCSGKEKEAVGFTWQDSSFIVIDDGSLDHADFLKYLAEQLGGEYIIGVSGLCRGASEIRKAYLQAHEASKYRLVKPSNSVLRFSEISEMRKEPAVPEELIRKIPMMVGTGRIKEIEDLLHQIFDMEKICSNSIEYLENLVYHVNRHIIQYFIENIHQNGETLEKQLAEIRNIYNYENVQQYFRDVRSCILEINDYLMTLKENYREKNEIEAAVRFVDENYHKDLSMTMVANHISLTYSYFSFLFKEHTGLSFVDYLRKVRIDKAQELLKTTDFKIAEIGGKIGYPNAKHFAKTFRAVTGISPMEYREKVL